jgi:RNA polymerase sigma factor for flagellar operon FliA
VSQLFEKVWLSRRRDLEVMAAELSRKTSGRASKGDLLAAGMVGLWQACEKFDPGCGTTLWDFAYIRVSGAMRDELRAMDHLSREARGRARRGEVVALSSPCSIDELIDGHLEMVSGLTSQDDPEALLLRDEARQSVLAAVRSDLDGLPQRLSYVLRATYFGGRRLADLGRELGVTESRVCQMRGEALQLLRRRHVVYCDNCRTKRLDGPDRCPRCQGRFRHLLPGEEVDDLPAARSPAPTARGSAFGEREVRGGAEQSGEAAAPEVGVGHVGRGHRATLTFKGETLSLAEWSRRTGVRVHTIYTRIANGWSVERALTEKTNRTRPGGLQEEEPQDVSEPAEDVGLEDDASPEDVVAAASEASDDVGLRAEMRRLLEQIDEIDCEIAALSMRKVGLISSAKSLVGMTEKSVSTTHSKENER